MDRAAATRAAKLLVANVERVIRGKRAAVEAAVTALLAGGHLLIEDVPGVGKTMLARSLARSIRGRFKRIQATPDLLPSDITGTSVFDQSERRFEFIEGPVFAHVVLVDEVNRTTPRTQSALLEAMDEAAVTVDGTRHSLPEPQFVVATQNPLEHHGTYPLPEGQLDRFAIAMELGYVTTAVERDIVRAQLSSHPIEELEPVLDPEEIIEVRRIVRETFVADVVLDYVLAIIDGTRSHSKVDLGASPRATISLVRCAQARALMEGREFVVPDDVKHLAVPVLAHRVLPVAALRLEPARRGEMVTEIVASTPVPTTGPGPPGPAPTAS